MRALFLQFLRMGISAGWLVLALVLLRPFLKKLPKWITCLLWSIVALRLVVPAFVQSSLSLLSDAVSSTGNILVSTGIPAAVGSPQATASASSLWQDIVPYAVSIWALGTVCMWAYYGISCMVIRRQTSARILLQDRVWLCDNVSTPFILGVFRPAIYIPSGIAQPQISYVLCHEYAHISRRDHLWKPLGFLLLSLYWYNPLIWVAYILLCRDIERACDEKVIARMSPADRKRYSEALLYCGARQRSVAVCPVAFAEVGVKSRIKSVLSYKKPSFWILAAALLVCIVLAVGFLTDPKPCIHVYTDVITAPATCTAEGVRLYTCTDCEHSYTEQIPVQSHSYAPSGIALASTCTQEGIAQLRCSACGHETTQAIPCAAHSFENSYVTREATCVSPGVRSAACAVCHQVLEVEQIPQNNVHDLQSTVTKAATCTAEGEALHTCSRCDHTEVSAIPKSEHRYVREDIKMATCSQEGKSRHKCADCADEYYVTSPPNGMHFYVILPGGVWGCGQCGYIAGAVAYTGNQTADILDDVTASPATGAADPVASFFP